MANDIKHVAVIGTGVIGASWTALFLARGLDVIATDVAPGAEGRLRQYVEEAWPALTTLGLAPGASRSLKRATAHWISSQHSATKCCSGS